MAVPLALLAAKTAIQGTAPALASLGRAATQNRKILYEDIQKLKAGKLGLSESEKARAQQSIQRNVETATKSAEDELRRQAAAAGFGRSGRVNEQAADLQQKKLGAIAQGTGQIDTASAQLADQRRAEVLNRISAQIARNQQNWMSATGNKGVAQYFANNQVSTPIKDWRQNQGAGNAYSLMDYIKASGSGAAVGS